MNNMPIIHMHDCVTIWPSKRKLTGKRFTRAIVEKDSQVQEYEIVNIQNCHLFEVTLVDSIDCDYRNYRNYTVNPIVTDGVKYTFFYNEYEIIEYKGEQEIVYSKLNQYKINH